MKKILLTTVCLSLLSGAVSALDTKAKYAILLDADTKYVMLDKRAEEPMPPASMSKLMTAYMVFDALKSGKLTLEDEFTVSDNAWIKGGTKSGSSTMFLKPRTTVKVKDLLRGVIVQSGNDACIVIAENMAGSEEAFADLMTQKAKKIGLKHSSFKNATGLPQKGHEMSAEDLAHLAQLIINEFPEYYSIYSEKTFKYNGIKQGNRNPLLYSMPGADGLKTGHTEASGFGLTGSVKTPDGRRLIMVINGLKSMNDRATESQKIMGWGVAGFENVKPFDAGVTIEKIPVWLGREKTVNAVLEKPALITVPKGRGSEITAKIDYDTPVTAPITKGQKLGTLTLTTHENKVYTYDLVAGEAVEKVGIIGKIIAVFSMWLGL